MEPEKDYIEINRQAWNLRTPVHLGSEFYDVKSFLEGKSSLNDIELGLLGDIKGKSLLHLQCHFGQDTISLARMGAHVTGVDLSDKAIEAANDLSRQTGADARFICCDLYDLPQHLSDSFDIVFTSYGTIGWLPDINRWAGIVARYLKPGGLFVIADFHPVVWMFDDDFRQVKYRYFNSEPIVEVSEGTYADRSADVQYNSVGWNHGLGEVVTALIRNGLEIRQLNEYDYSPYSCFRHLEKHGEKCYRINGIGDKMPMVYAIEAVKKKV